MLFKLFYVIITCCSFHYDGGLVLSGYKFERISAQEVLKLFKANVGNPQLDWLEAIVVRTLRFWPDQFGDWTAEVWHQVGLRSAARGDWTEAHWRFENARRLMKSPLGIARIDRDNAWVLAAGFGEVKQALSYIETAFQNHDRDQGNVVKAHRQRLITETYRLRIAWLGDHNDEHITELCRIIRNQGRSFYNRDALVIIEFIQPLVDENDKIALGLQTIPIHARKLHFRRALVQIAWTTARVDLLLARKLASRVLRKE